MTPITISDEEVIRLVEELAALEGESVTTVIVEAVQQRLASRQRARLSDERAQFLLEWGKRIRDAESPESLARDPVADLYDETTGLPT
jgi:hypothetical protein